MTDEMLDLARANAAKAKATNVEFVKGTIEDVPLPDESVEVVISNCVINLSVDKPAVLAEMFRVLKPGGRVGVSDVVAEDQLTHADRAERGSYVGCIAGALSRSEYLDGLARVGFVDATVEFTYEAAPGMHGAIVRAVKPGTVKPTTPARDDTGQSTNYDHQAAGSSPGSGAGATGRRRGGRHRDPGLGGHRVGDHGDPAQPRGAAAAAGQRDRDRRGPGRADRGPRSGQRRPLQPGRHPRGGGPPGRSPRRGRRVRDRPGRGWAGRGRAGEPDVRPTRVPAEHPRAVRGRRCGSARP